ncbi:predicted protein [Chaetoceros tenuissimus]|uniref:Transmembrane protein n=1 Tax=Chaetoceros tenuissimus TaxID=426638 RepID=A0AAD3GZG7_9STRA|nr:predicted protein [Chaetoceros tenuissimus]
MVAAESSSNNVVNLLPSNEKPESLQERITSTESLQSKSSLKEKVKDKARQKVYKIRDRTVPVTKKQKRSRFMPGKRYLAFLWVANLFHPVFVLASNLKGKFMNEEDHHHHHRHGHHEEEDELSEGEENLLVEEGEDGRLHLIANDHELLVD